MVYRSRHYGEIQQRIEGISQKVLTQVLRRLERNGLVAHTVLSEMPPSVEYSLTDLGQTLLEPLQAIATGSIAHFPEVAAAQRRYDEPDKI